MINDKSDEVIEKLSRYKIWLETLMKGSDFIFDCVHLLHYKCHEINFKCGGLYIDSSDWIRHKKATINPINRNNHKCFQYAITVTLDHEEIGKYPERITKIKTFVDKYNWEWINYTSEKDDWKKLEKYNLTTPLMLKKKKIYPAYVSRHNSDRDFKKVFILLIRNGEG